MAKKKKEDTVESVVGMILNEFEKDATEIASQVPSDKELVCLRSSIQKMLDLENKIEQKEAELKQLNEEHELISTGLIPEEMLRMGFRELRLEDDGVVRVDKQVFASISEMNKPQAFRWLRKHGHGDLIKNKITIALSKGMDAVVKPLMDLCKQYKVKPERKEDVNSQTLKAFAKEQLAQGVVLPKEFSVHQRDVAVVKYSKTVKKI